MTHAYGVWNYGEMISDATRMSAYDAALRRHINQDSVVLDIGTGTGIFAMLACRYGARRVIAVEPSQSIEVAREIARDNGLADRIQFVKGRSNDLELAERATVIVSDLRSVLPLFEHHQATIADARERLLAPGGVLIPQQDTLWAGLVTAPRLHDRIVGPYRDNCYDLDMDAALKYVTNEWRRSPQLDCSELFLQPQQWATLNYRTWDDPDVSGELRWELDADARVFGFTLWFDAELSEGIEFSNHPGKQKLIYGQAFFPWPQPLDLAAGNELQLDLTARLSGGEYVWTWKTHLYDPQADTLRAQFTQSTFQRAPLALDQLRKRTLGFRPQLSEQGQLERAILSAMSGRLSIEEIARQVAAQFPHRFTDWQDVTSLVADVSERYSQ